MRLLIQITFSFVIFLSSAVLCSTPQPQAQVQVATSWTQRKEAILRLNFRDEGSSEIREDYQDDFYCFSRSLGVRSLCSRSSNFVKTLESRCECYGGTLNERLE
ncbi:hypothetical protein BDZ45DRAFT_672198 [Acephala macrosclerotiorum]|nr:hypothetical protein BDZ45DRAFT_672198 [Acephala macrosclerotiorum]